jgi:Txe/YoeB family toxin of Txe-Axe toxin-antitoxin module
MFFIQSLALFLTALSGPPEVPTIEESEFAYYFGEFVTYSMEDANAMSRLITDRLADSLFQSETNETLQTRLKLIKNTSQEYPELVGRFAKLDARLQTTFNARVTKSKSHKLIYTAAGALVGAIIGFPAGKLLSNHSALGTKMLWITVPAGALVGAGAGYLLSGLIEKPDSSHSSNLMSKDLETIEAELNH